MTDPFALKKKLDLLKVRPTDQELLELYGYYKQATIGDCNIPEPSMFNYTSNSKWHAWNKQRGLSRDLSIKRWKQAALEILSKYS